MSHRNVWPVLITILIAVAARADLVVRDNGIIFEAKVVSVNDQDASLIPDYCDASALLHLSRSVAVRVLTTDAHGALLKDSASPEGKPAGQITAPVDPVAPPITAAQRGPTYYVIPLHGEVGETVLASALEKSLADAVRRKPTVVVLDIDSPGGLVDEARQIIKVLHGYNKKVRIVALIDEDLSAAAISTLSVKEIYVKSSATIGAATSYVPGNLMLPPKLEEKMQSAWRAEARNSAEEGGHEPMLADAMIDNDQELHWETVDGKPVVKDGPGDHMICRRGKILTLSSHEAVDCGLAAGEADDFDELGKALKFDKWTQMAGLGTLLADAVAKRSETYQAQMEKIEAQFQQDIHAAVTADPSESVTTVTRVLTLPAAPMGPQVPMPGGPRYYPRVPGAPFPGAPGGYARAPGATRILTQTQSVNTALWKPKSLQCVVALQQCEADLKQAAALAGAYSRSSEAAMLTELLDKIAAIRASVYDDRDRYVRALFPGGDLETGQAGNDVGNGYVTTSRNSLPVLGFRYRTANNAKKPVVEDLAPVFVRPVADSAANASLVVAKPGYAVGGIIVDANATNVVAVKVIFMAYGQGRLNRAVSYTSDWIGQPDGGTTKTIANNGELVMGTCGKQIGNAMVAIGLVVRPLDANK